MNPENFCLLEDEIVELDLIEIEVTVLRGSRSVLHLNDLILKVRAATVVHTYAFPPATAADETKSHFAIRHIAATLFLEENMVVVGKPLVVAVEVEGDVLDFVPGRIERIVLNVVETVEVELNDLKLGGDNTDENLQKSHFK